MGTLTTTSSASPRRSEEHTSELQSPCNLVCRLLLEKKKNQAHTRNSSLHSPRAGGSDFSTVSEPSTQPRAPRNTMRAPTAFPPPRQFYMTTTHEDD